MKRNLLVFSLGVVILIGFAAFFSLWQMSFDSSRGQIINYADLRLLLMTMSGGVLVFLAGILLTLIIRGNFAKNVCAFLDEKLIGQKPWLFLIQGAILILIIFLFECFILTYAAFPVPMRPIFAWAMWSSFFIWFMFRIVYASEYRQQPKLIVLLKNSWDGWQHIQRKTFIILAGLGLIYFLIFIPSNFRLEKAGNFYLHADEAVIYPDVAKVLNTEGSISEIVHRFIDWPWWYGFPYLPISASVLVIPRLIFGNDYANNIQLNMFLLRQFINVLPLVLALILLIYLVNRFKSLWGSITIFVFMIFVPGILKFNLRFWHPDSIIILLILLTFLSLEKDRMRFGKFFYIAGVFCGLTTAIKLWGVFFVLAIGGYLLAGLLQKHLTLKKAVFSGIGFILVMAITIIITSPVLMVPAIREFAMKGWLQQQNSLLHGYNEPDPEGVYKTGLVTWLRYFGYYYMKPFFFFFSFFTLFIGSIWGKRKYLYRLLLAWSIPTGFFLIYFTAMKSFQYMLPLMIPLFLGGLMSTSLIVSEQDSKTQSLLKKPLIQKTLWLIIVLICFIQFSINFFILNNSAWFNIF